MESEISDWFHTYTNLLILASYLFSKRKQIEPNTIECYVLGSLALSTYNVFVWLDYYYSQARK